MKKPTRKQVCWTAGLTIVLLFALMVIPGLEYELKGPWGTSIEKRSYDTTRYFRVQLPYLRIGYNVTHEEYLECIPYPQGFTSNEGNYYYQWGRCLFVVKKVE
jgi:hypothetical protein